MTDFVGTDLNSARRNLVLISVAFIIYALGDGELGTKSTDGTGIGFFGGTIYLKNTLFLGYFACALYLWFMLRYIQEFIGSNAWHFTLENIPMGYLCRLYLRNLSVKNGSAKANNYIVLRSADNRNTPLSSWVFRGDNSSTPLELPWWNIPLKFIFILEAAISRKQFSIYYFPFMLWAAGASFVYLYKYS